MSIISTKNILINAKNSKYAVPAFNIHNLETMISVLDVAERLKSPVILAATPSTVKFAGASYLVAIAEAASNNYNIPIALHLDHFEDVGLIKDYIKIGFSSAMIDASRLSFDENINITNEVVRFAKDHNVSIEAELGRLVGEEDGIVVSDKESIYTDPTLAKIFVEKTGIDSLAIAIGTAHGLYKSEPRLDFGRLKQIRDIVDIPLVLHGASGVPNDSVIKTIDIGISKVNIATELKIAFGEAVKEYFIKNPNENDPRKYLIPGKTAMEKVVENKIIMCGSNGKA